MNDAQKTTFSEVKIGDYFFVVYGTDVDYYIRVDDRMKAVDLNTGLLWDFHNGDIVYIIPDKYSLLFEEKRRAN